MMHARSHIAEVLPTEPTLKNAFKQSTHGSRKGSACTRSLGSFVVPRYFDSVMFDSVPSVGGGHVIQQRKAL
ncbi:hypothetical protein PISMIDRAFT_672895 [Pisolithus microcarpus 441]|uniref:Uncharacterized protein n=1 Tax=Pisolithus microcarpus 441 TaxID=765257 RepID=A0A0D0A2P8_9AGAM|nr:hypothetical protein PISMIDRAFT_672895 [Pisolithus microcarpus 441]